MNEQAPIIIGITGRLGVGKSTLAGLIAESIPDARVVAFADALKTQVHTMLGQSIGGFFVGLTREDLDSLKPTCFGPIYQGYGELMRYLLGDDYWIRVLQADLPPRAIVADVRYPNEAAWIKARGGLLVAVSGPCRRDGDRRSPEHPSERHIEEIVGLSGWRIENNGSLPDLQAHAERVARAALARAGIGATS